MVVKVSKRLENRISRIVSSKEPQQYMLECELVNPEHEWKYKVRAVKAFSLTQNFDTDYMDQMSMTIDVTPEEYKKLVENVTGLRCTLRIYPVDLQMNLRMDKKLTVIEAIVLIPGMEDMEKNLGASFIKTEDGPKRAYQHELYGPLELQLVEPTAYDFRHIQINTMFGRTKLEPILHWSGKVFGAKKCKITKPDNELEYNNIIIPPMKDVSNFLPYLQETYGIYSKGLGYYFTDDTYYVYPIYDTDNSQEGVDASMVHFISATNSGLRGKINHTFIEKDLWIVTDSLKSMTTNTATSENYGTAVTVIKADMMRDQEVTRSPDGKITRNANDMTVIQQQNKGGRTSKEMQNMKFMGSTTNLYIQTSEMAKNDGTYAVLSWASAYLKAFYPGQKVLVHFDGAESAYRTQKGTILRVAYHSRTLKDSGLTKPVMRFVATIALKLDSDYSSGESYQYSS